jgi:hypothetical protein
VWKPVARKYIKKFKNNMEDKKYQTLLPVRPGRKYGDINTGVMCNTL